MRENKKFINLICIFLALLFFLNPLTVKADNSKKYTETSSGLTFAINPGEDGAGGANEQGIVDSSKFDASQVKFRNLDDLNIAIDDLWTFVRWFLSILSVFGTISSFFILTKSFLQLAFITDHPIERKKVYTDILTSGVCTILFAGLSLFMTVFYKTFENFFRNSTMLSSDYKSAFALFLVEYKYLIVGVDAVMALTLILFLIKDILNLAAGGADPRARASSIKSILFTIVAIMGCGGVGLLVGIFSGMFVV